MGAIPGADAYGVDVSIPEAEVDEPPARELVDCGVDDEAGRRYRRLLD